MQGVQGIPYHRDWRPRERAAVILNVSALAQTPPAEALSRRYAHEAASTWEMRAVDFATAVARATVKAVLANRTDTGLEREWFRA